MLDQKIPVYRLKKKVLRLKREIALRKLLIGLMMIQMKGQV